MKTLTREQIQDLQDDLIATMPTYTHFKIDDLCDMALRYREVLDAEPVAWLHKETKELNNGWDAILDNTGNWIPLIVAPRGEK